MATQTFRSHPRRSVVAVAVFTDMDSVLAASNIPDVILDARQRRSKQPFGLENLMPVAERNRRVLRYHFLGHQRRAEPLRDGVVYIGVLQRPLENPVLGLKVFVEIAVATLERSTGSVFGRADLLRIKT